MIHSDILVDKRRDVRPLKWLTTFLVMSVIYLGTDSGCMEIFVERISLVSWSSLQPARDEAYTYACCGSDTHPENDIHTPPRH